MSTSVGSDKGADAILRGGCPICGVPMQSVAWFQVCPVHGEVSGVERLRAAWRYDEPVPSTSDEPLSVCGVDVFQAIRGVGERLGFEPLGATELAMVVLCDPSVVPWDNGWDRAVWLTSMEAMGTPAERAPEHRRSIARSWVELLEVGPWGDSDEIFEAVGRVVEVTVDADPETSDLLVQLALVCLERSSEAADTSGASPGASDRRREQQPEFTGRSPSPMDKKLKWLDRSAAKSRRAAELEPWEENHLLTEARALARSVTVLAPCDPEAARQRLERGLALLQQASHTIGPRVREACRVVHELAAAVGREGLQLGGAETARVLGELLGVLDHLAGFGFGAPFIAATRVCVLNQRLDLEASIAERRVWTRRLVEAGRTCVETTAEDDDVESWWAEVRRSARGLAVFGQVHAACLSVQAQEADMEIWIAAAKKAAEEHLRGRRSDSWAWDGGLARHADLHGLLARMHLLRGELDQARPFAERCWRLCERGLGIYEPERAGRALAGAYRLMGTVALDDAEKTRWFKQSLKLEKEVADLSGDAGTNHYGRALALTCLGRLDDALEALEAAAEAGFTKPHLARFDFELRPLRGLARFEAVVSRLERQDTQMTGLPRSGSEP